MTDRWRITVTVALTAEEVAVSNALQTGGDRRSPAWPTVAASVLAGFLVALIAVLAGVSAPRPAGLLAVLGFLAFFGGMWFATWINMRANRVRADRQRERAMEAYEMTFDASGATMVYPNRVHRLQWSYFEAVDGVRGLLMLWTTIGFTAVTVPERALPSRADAAALLAEARQRIAAARVTG